MGEYKYKDIPVFRLKGLTRLGCSRAAHIQPLCLGEEELRPGLEARVAGWGATHPTLLTRPKVLQTTEVVTVDNKLCEQWHWYDTEQST